MTEWQPIESAPRDGTVRKVRGQVVYSAEERIERLSIPEPNSGCWLWLGTTRGGYGRLVVGSRTAGTRRSIGAHQLSYLTYCGPIPSGFEVCHKCDIRACVNPAHLFAGTRQDNVDDRERKGRNALLPRLRGDAHPQAKLSDADVEIIRTLTWTSREVAKAFGINDSYVRQIRRHKYRPAPPQQSQEAPTAV